MIQRIGKYEVIERIGRGGMGTIFKARDPILERAVALKVLSSLEVTHELRARFFREAQACARLSHPNIVTIYDMGEDDGRLYIVMELLEGEELRQIIARRAPLALEDKLSILLQICDGLHYAHQRGVVHRDVKPANILLLRAEQVKILDFGIAQLAAATQGELTRTGMIMGTLRYMAPEQVRGRADHRSDIFSVAALSYELLCWRPPFTGDDPLQLLEQLRTATPPSLCEVDPALPSALAAIVERAMQREPEDRYVDMGQMSEALELVHRDMAEEAEGVRARVLRRRDELAGLHRALAERIGTTRPGEPLPQVTERRRLATLQALEREMAERIEVARSLLARADALAPALERARQLLEAGQFAGAAAEFEAIVAEAPEHHRAQEGLAAARAAVEEAQRQERAAAAEAARQEREQAAVARDEMNRARAAAQRHPTAHAPPLWVEAEARAAVAGAAIGQEAHAEARLAFAAAAAAYRRFDEAASEARRRLREAAERARQQVAAARDRARMAPQHARELWAAAEARAAEGEAILTPGDALAPDTHREALRKLDEAADLYGRAEDQARDALRAMEIDAPRAREAAVADLTDAWRPPETAVADPLEDTVVQAPAVAPALPDAPGTRADVSGSRPASLPRTRLLRRVAIGAAAVAAVGIAIVYGRPAPPTREPAGTTAVPAREPAGTTAVPAREPGGKASVAPNEDAAKLEAVEQSRARVRLVRDEAVRAGAEKLAPALFSAAVQQVQEGDLARDRRDLAIAHDRYRAAIEAFDGARIEAGRADALARAESEARLASGRASAARRSAQAAGAPPTSSSTASASTPGQRDATTPTARDPGRGDAVSSVTPGTGGGGSGPREVAEQARARVATAKRKAEQVAAGFFAHRRFTAAQSKERDGLAALARSDYEGANRLFADAQSEYQAAAQEAAQEAERDRQLAPLKATLEQAHAAVAARRQEALAADAERLARDVFDQAQARQVEGDGLVRRQDLVAAAQAYREAAERYGEAIRRARSGK